MLEQEIIDENGAGFIEYKQLLLSELRRLSMFVMELQKELKNLALVVERLRLTEKILFVLLGVSLSAVSALVVALLKYNMIGS